MAATFFGRNLPLGILISVELEVSVSGVVGEEVSSKDWDSLDFGARISGVSIVSLRRWFGRAFLFRRCRLASSAASLKDGGEARFLALII